MVDVYIPEQEEDTNLTQQYHDYAKAGTLDVLGATLDETLYYNPANALARLSDQYLFEGTRGRVLSKEEWASSDFFREGIEVGEEGIKEGLANLLAERHDERLDFQVTLRRSRGGFGLGAAQFGVALAGSVLDPLNVASAFIPTVGLARGATIASRLGRKGNRFTTGMMDGAIGAAVVEPLVIGAAAAEQDRDYGLMDSFLNVALGSALGGGLHWGVGKLTDRINRTPPQTRDTAQQTAIGQVASDQEVTAGRLIEDAEDAASVRSEAETMVVYDSEGNGRVVDVVNSDVEGQITIREIDGTEKVVDESDARAKSPFDEEYTVNVGDSTFGDLPDFFERKLSEATPEELAQMSAVLDKQIKEYFPNDPKKLADKKAIEIEQRRRAGEVVERPAEPTQTATAQAEIARLREENNKIQQDVLAKQKKEGLDKPRLTLAQLSKIEENNRRIAQLESKLAKADDVAVQQQGQQTAQQIDDARDVESMQTDNLGALGEFREGADQLEAQPTELGELDPDVMEAENQTMLDALQDEDVQALLPEQAKASLRDADTLIAKAEQYEEIVEAGRVCVVGSKGT
tara:strand:- start:1620 stop:3341 length:1722 start_codon:yes stop_codon:yes gene_type:complete